MAHTVVVLPRADGDIRRIYSRIMRTVSPASAQRWYSGILAKIRSLANLPERWPLADEAADLGIELRMLPHGRGRHVYRILFTIAGQTVNVHRVRHAAQDYLDPDDI